MLLTFPQENVPDPSRSGRSVVKVPGPKSTNGLSLKDEGSSQHLLREY